VTVRSVLSHRGFGRAVLLVLCASFVPLPALAAEATSHSTVPVARAAAPVAAPAPDLHGAVIKAVQRDVAIRPSVARRSQSGVPNADSPSFFKTPAGIAVLAVFAAGVGYAIYSTRNDRINSPGRQ
jgi:hypothetical protein